jgi:hypothetical protein
MMGWESDLPPSPRRRGGKPTRHRELISNGVSGSMNRMRNTNTQQQQTDEPQNVWEEFGLTRPKYEDERAAPPVDWERLRALVEKRIPEEERRELYKLTIRFRSWAEALAEIDAGDLQKGMSETSNPQET